MMRVNRLFAASVAIALLSAPAAAQKPMPIPFFVLPKDIDGFEGHQQIDC